MRSHGLRVERRARFHTVGDIGTAQQAWFLLHGYGELASSMLARCATLEEPRRVLVAPEALSRFYLRGGQGPIGASWMTRERRKDEIDDYVAYLDAIARALSELGLPADARPCALGFSQGAATAWRWGVLGLTRISALVLWGAAPPLDLDPPLARSRLSSARVAVVRGKRDPLVDEPAWRASVESVRAAGVPVTAREFDGGHELEPSLLVDLARELTTP